MSDSNIPLKQCRRCKQLLPATSKYFYVRHDAHGSFRHTCKQCCLEQEKRNKWGDDYDKKVQKAEERKELILQGLRECTRCHKIFPATSKYFTKSSSKSGLNSWCKGCCRDYVLENFDRIALQRRNHRLENIEEFRQRDHDYHARHRIIRLASNRHWRESNRDRYLTYHRDYYYKHRERKLQNRKLWTILNREVIRSHNRGRKARLKGASGKHTATDVALQFKSQRGLCWWCGLPLDPARYHVDHRIPLSKGGSNAAGNICIACPKCNLSKKDKMPWEWNGRLL